MGGEDGFEQSEMEGDGVGWVESALFEFGDGQTEEVEDERDRGWFEQFDLEDSGFEHLGGEEGGRKGEGEGQQRESGGDASQKTEESSSLP